MTTNVSRTQKFSSNPYAKPNYKAQIANVLSETFQDIVEMCFTKHTGKNYESTRRKDSVSMEQKVIDDSNENPFIDYLSVNAQAISEYTGTSKEEIINDSKRIWKVMPAKYKNYYWEIYAPRQEGSEGANEATVRNNMKMEEM